MDITSEIDKLKHFHVENYSDTNFTDDLNDGEEFLYTTIRCKDDKEIAPDNWIMAVDANNTNLLLLNAYYNIQWEECSCLRGIRLEDVTVELEKEAYEEMRHNI